MKKITEKEIREKGYMNFYNNFFANLPGGFYRYTELYKGSEELYNLKLSENFKDSPKSKYDPVYSKLILNQSFREFHKTIDDVFEELGINPKKLIKLQKGGKVIGYPEVIYEAFEKEILQVYSRLREMGYKHYPDLIA